MTTTERPAPPTPPTEWIPEFTYGDRLRLIRRDMNLDQQEFADLIGVKKVTLGAWEVGRSIPKDLLAFSLRVSAVTGVPAAWVIGVAPGLTHHTSQRARPDSNRRPTDYQLADSTVINVRFDGIAEDFLSGDEVAFSAENNSRIATVTPIPGNHSNARAGHLL